MRERLADIGLLLGRVGLGLMFVGHGWPKLSGGPDKWVKLGGAMGKLGIDFLPTFWGFMGAFAEFGGGLLVAVGLFFRPACALVVMTMIVAANMHLQGGDGIMGSSHAIEAAFAFSMLALLGPGPYSLDALLFTRKRDDADANLSPPV